MNFIIGKKERRLTAANISYYTDSDLYANYKGYSLKVSQQETGGFYAIVKNPKGKKIINNHINVLYMIEAVKSVMITICSMVDRDKEAEMR